MPAKPTLGADPAALAMLDAAQQLEREAERLRAAAARRMEFVNYAKFESGMRALARAVLESADPDAAIAEAVAAGHREDTIRRWLKIAAREDADAARAAEAVEIARLAARGWNNAQIGRKLGMHPKTVSRKLQEGLRRNGNRC